MTDAWLAVGVPAVVTLITAWYTTGGRSALARRAIREDIEVAQLLAPGPTRTALEKVAEEKAIRYASTWIGTKALTLRQHLFLAALSTAGAALTWTTAKVQTDLRPSPIWSIGLSTAMLLGLGTFALFVTYWVSLVVTADKAKDRAGALQAQREQIGRYVNPETVG